MGASLAGYAALALALDEPFRGNGLPPGFFDLRVYHVAAERIVAGVPLYGHPIIGRLGFTYPPFAALLFTPLTLGSVRFDEGAVTALNVALLVLLLRRALAIPGRPAGPRPALRASQAWALAALCAAAAIWLEPVSVAIGYGQADLLIDALVFYDLSRPDSAATKGVAIGLASAIKLTPLIFIPYLWLSGRRRAAVLGAGAFVGSIVLSFAVVPRASIRYWTGRVLSVSHVGRLGYAANQSLAGMIARLSPTAARTPALHGAMLGAMLLVALAGLALSARLSRAGDEAAGASILTITALLVSPVSWNHHWTIALAPLLLLYRRAYRTGSVRLAGAAAVMTLIGYMYLPEIAERHPHLHGLETLWTTDPYVLLGLLVLTVSALAAARGRAPCAKLRHTAGAGPSAGVGPPPVAGASVRERTQEPPDRRRVAVADRAVAPVEEL